MKNCVAKTFSLLKMQVIMYWKIALITKRILDLMESISEHLTSIFYFILSGILWNLLSRKNLSLYSLIHVRSWQEKNLVSDRKWFNVAAYSSAEFKHMGNINSNKTSRNVGNIILAYKKVSRHISVQKYYRTFFWLISYLYFVRLMIMC